MGIVWAPMGVEVTIVKVINTSQNECQLEGRIVYASGQYNDRESNNHGCCYQNLNLKSTKNGCGEKTKS